MKKPRFFNRLHLCLMTAIATVATNSALAGTSQLSIETNQMPVAAVSVA